jgi:hypothetical protein
MQTFAFLQHFSDIHSQRILAAKIIFKNSKYHERISAITSDEDVTYNSLILGEYKIDPISKRLADVLLLQLKFAQKSE